MSAISPRRREAGRPAALYRSESVQSKCPNQGPGSSRFVAQRQALVHDLPLVPVEPAIGEIVQTYIRHRVMPTDPGGDALHLALASLHRCD